MAGDCSGKLASSRHIYVVPLEGHEADGRFPRRRMKQPEGKCMHATSQLTRSDVKPACILDGRWWRIRVRDSNVCIWNGKPVSISASTGREDDHACKGIKWQRHLVLYERLLLGAHLVLNVKRASIDASSVVFAACVYVRDMPRNSEGSRSLTKR